MEESGDDLISLFWPIAVEGTYSRMKNLKPVEDFLKECTNAIGIVFTVWH